MTTCPAVTTLCGLINGAIIFDLNVPAMIATLGTQNVIRGIVKLLCGALKAIYEKGLRIPEDISFISYGNPEFSPDMTKNSKVKRTFVSFRKIRRRRKRWCMRGGISISGMPPQSGFSKT